MQDQNEDTTKKEQQTHAEKNKDAQNKQTNTKPNKQEGGRNPKIMQPKQR